MESLDVAALIEQSIQQVALSDGAKLVLAYSGGVDSELLCLGLAQYAQSNPQFNYLLVHVHHGLSEHAEQWLEHCKTRAKGYQLAINCQRVSLSLGPRVSTEAAAREARYQVFQQYVQPGDVLLTAHHQDDQLETILLALKRGLGPKGLAAMGQVQPYAEKAWLVRPLLNVTREQIEHTASLLALTHIEDESNADTQFDRNFLRHDIIPRLKQRWGAITTTSSRSAALCAQQQQLLDEVVSERLPALINHSNQVLASSLDLDSLAQYSLDWQAMYLRAFIEQCGFSLPSQAQLHNLLSQLMYAKTDAQIHIVLKGMLAKRYQQQLFLLESTTYQQPMAVIGSNQLDVSGEVNAWQVNLNDGSQLQFHVETLGSGLKKPNAKQHVTVRFGAAGSVIVHPSSRQKSRELKKVWQEFGVPPWERARVPLVYYDDKLVSAVGYWVEKAYLSQNGEPHLAVRHQPKSI